MARAVLFDLYETLITENHPEWHASAPRPGERLGLSREDFEREWSARYRERMSGRLRRYGDVLREISLPDELFPADVRLVVWKGGLPCLPHPSA